MKKRALWHEEAKQMKRDGVTMWKIADHFGVSIQQVERVTAGVPAVPKIAVGFDMGKRKGVMCRFDPSTFDQVSTFAKDAGVSFSKAVSDLVSQAMLNKPTVRIDA